MSVNALESKSLPNWQAILDQSQQQGPAQELRSDGTDSEFFSSLKESSVRWKEEGVMGEEKDRYLKLLMAELNHQNPLDPFDHNQMASQLAQFHSVEELSSIREAISLLSQNQSRASQPAWDGESLYLKPGFRLQERASSYEIVADLPSQEKIQIHFFDEETGQVLHEELWEPKQSGFQILSWTQEDLKAKGLDLNHLGVRGTSSSGDVELFELFDPVGFKQTEEGLHFLNQKGSLASQADYPLLLKKQFLKTYENQTETTSMTQSGENL